MLENREKYEYLVRARIKQYEILNEIKKKESYKYYTMKKMNKFQKHILRIIGVKILFEEQPEGYKFVGVETTNAYKE